MPLLFFSPKSYTQQQLKWCVYQRRSVGSLRTGVVTAGQFVTQQHIDAFVPSSLRRIKRIRPTPPTDLERLYHRHLDKVCADPSMILKLYTKYSRAKPQGSLSLYIRYLTALSHCFNFNSFWATEDKQNLHKMLSFKCLMYDIVNIKHKIEPIHVPRLIYSMACLEYRSYHLCPTVLDIVEASIGVKPPTLATIGLCLALMGIGDSSGHNQFGPASDLSRDYSGLLEKICVQVGKHLTNKSNLTDRTARLAPFEAAGLAFGMVMADLYDMCVPIDRTQDNPIPILPLLLKEACKEINQNNILHSGWVQFYLYQTLYCTDVEKPEYEVEIKKSIPIQLQKILHLQWLDKILLNGQPQGSEKLQQSVDTTLKRLEVADALINCSAGRQWDEQHCWFAGHIIKSRNLSLHYDYTRPLGPKRPKPSGWLQLQNRMMNHFGYHSAFIHKHFWDSLSGDEQDIQMLKLLARFPIQSPPEITSPPLPQYDTNPGKLQKFKKTYAEQREKCYDVKIVL